MIYELVLPSHRGFVRFFHKTYPGSGDIRPAKISINLLLTCRQIYNEGLPVLYKVNNFCISPLVSKPFETDGEVQQPKQNAKWLTSMPLAGRQAVRTVELRIPVPCTDEPSLKDYDDMSTFFPNLRKLTLFLDSAVAHGSLWDSPGLEAYRTFFTGLKALLPMATTTVYDLSFVERDDTTRPPPDIVVALKRVFGQAEGKAEVAEGKLAKGKSMFMAQENTWHDKYERQEDAEFTLLRAKFPGRADDWAMELGYWDLRQEGMGDGTDDDSDEEDRLFGSWEVNWGAQRKLAWFTGDFDNM